jgi:hypothetical protein
MRRKTSEAAINELRHFIPQACILRFQIGNAGLSLSEHHIGWLQRVDIAICGHFTLW